MRIRREVSAPIGQGRARRSVARSTRANAQYQLTRAGEVAKLHAVHKRQPLMRLLAGLEVKAL
jgi:hypothetical protein